MATISRIRRNIVFRGMRFLYYKSRVVVFGIFSQIINFWYGNTAGWNANYGAWKELTQLRQVFKNSYGDKFSTECEHRDELKDKGFILLKQAIDQSSISAVSKHVKTIFSSKGLYGTSPNGASLHIFEPEKDESFKQLLTPQIKGIIESYYGCAFRVNTVRVWRNNHVPGADNNRHDVFSNTFHHDNSKVTGLKVFILLVDGVTKETGALRFHDSKTSTSIVRNFGYFHRFMLTKSMVKRMTDPKSLKYFEGNAGDCAIINTQQCLHAASIPKLGSYRDILQFEIYPNQGSLRSNDFIFSQVPEDHEINTLRAI